VNLIGISYCTAVSGQEKFQARARRRLMAFKIKQWFEVLDDG
jgi:hypothetical protein